MVTAAHLIYAALHVALLVVALRLLGRDRRWTMAILAITIASLVYDNLVIGLGHLLGPGELLQSLNFPRFLAHAIFTPLLGIIGLELARNGSVDWAWTRRGAISFWVLVLSAIAWGLYTDVAQLRMEPAFAGETVRYANANAGGPPLPALTVMSLLMFAGLGLIIRHRWPWLFLGAVAMFTIAAFASGLGIVANLGEVLLLASIVISAQRFPALSRAAYLSHNQGLSPAERERLADQQRGRKRRLAVGNRYMAWVMAPILLVGTLAYYRAELGIGFLNETIDGTANSLFIILFFIHAVASFYFYGVPRPRLNIRVVHVYIGYGVFLFTMVSQSVIGMEPLHMITYVINWLFIGAHLALSTRFMLKRVTRQKQDPMLEIVVSKKFQTSTAGD